LRFLIDAQLSSSFARVLRDWGYDAEQVFDLGMAAAADADIWRHAIQRSSVIVTKDSDVAARRRASPTGPVVVWIRFGNTSKAASSESCCRSCHASPPRSMRAKP